MTNKMLNISKQIHAGWSTTTSYELPVAEVIPGGDTSNEKRKITNASARYTNLTEYSNIPLPGFTLYKADRKNYGSLDQTWLVIDPRGFLVRISSDNLQKILHVTGITEGLIQEKCIWARENSETKLTLVPVSSPSYLEAVENTELIESKVSTKDVQIGDTVMLQNKLQGRYMGTLSLYGPLYEYSARTRESKVQAWPRRQIIEVADGKFYFGTDVKMLKIVSPTTTPMTREESAKFLNDQIATGNAFFSSNPKMNGKYYGTYGVIKHVSVHAVPKVEITFDKVDRTEVEELFNIAVISSDAGIIVLENHKNKLNVIDFPYSFNPSANITINSFAICSINMPNTADPVYSIETSDIRKSMWGSSRTVPNECLDNFTKYYKIVKHVKNETYI